MFWDGERWLDERTLEAERTVKPRDRRPRHRSHTLTVLLIVPFLLAALAGPRLAQSVGTGMVRSSADRVGVYGALVAGNVVKVIAHDFGIKRIVELRWDGRTLIGTKRTNRFGNFITWVRIPGSATTGDHFIDISPPRAAGRLMLTSLSTTSRASGATANGYRVHVKVRRTGTPTPVTAPAADPTATPDPTAAPTATPDPTPPPAATPSPDPTATPTPTTAPTSAPTTAPTATPAPTAAPTTAPTATPAPTTAPTPAPTVAPTATPRPTAAPTPVPTPTPTAAPTATPTAAPTATPRPTVAPTTAPAACGSLQARIDATPSGSTLDLSGCTYAGRATVNKPMTIVGGTINVPAGSAGITVTANDVTLDGMTITGSNATTYNSGEYGVYTLGTTTAPYSGLTVRDCVIGNFGNTGIFASHPVDLRVSGNQIHDVVYAGVRVLSGQVGLVDGNTVQRVGVNGASANSNNAYGIDLEAIASGNLTKDPPTADYTVTGNTVEDVPTWHALDTHNGLRVSFTNNTVRRAMRAVFITTDSLGNRSRNITVSGNQLLSPAPITTNIIAVTLYNVTTVSVTNNVEVGWGSSSPVYDYGGGSTGVVTSGNAVTP